MINSNYSFFFKNQTVTRNDVEQFFKGLWDARRPAVVPKDLYYLSWTRFPVFTNNDRKIYELSEFDLVNVLDFHSAAGPPQENPFFVQYGDCEAQVQLDNGVLLVPRTFTRQDMLRAWFETFIKRFAAQSARKRVLIIDEDRARPSDDFKRYCLEKNVHIVCIPSKLSPHFAMLDISMGKFMTCFYESCMSVRTNDDWVAEYTKARNRSRGSQIYLKWNTACITILEPDFQKVVDKFWRKVETTMGYARPPGRNTPPQIPSSTAPLSRLEDVSASASGSASCAAPSLQASADEIQPGPNPSDSEQSGFVEDDGILTFDTARHGQSRRGPRVHMESWTSPAGGLGGKSRDCIIL